MIPTQKHKRARSKGPCKTDKSKAHISDAKGSKSNRPAGMENTVQGGPKGMAKKPKGTRVIAPGGRIPKSRGYPG